MYSIHAMMWVNLKNTMLNGKKPDTKEYVLYDYIYMVFLNKQNKSVVIDLRSVVTIGSEDKTGQRHKRTSWGDTKTYKFYVFWGRVMVISKYFRFYMYNGLFLSYENYT